MDKVNNVLTLCSSDNTVPHDALVRTMAGEVEELDHALSSLDRAMNATMGAFNEVLHAMSKVGRIYNNLSVACSAEVQERLKAFELETRSMLEKGLYPAFNQDVLSGTAGPLSGMKTEIKSARQAIELTKKVQSQYESACKVVESKESDMAKKGKQIATDSSYQKNVRDREAKKTAYEKERAKVEAQVSSIRSKMGPIAIQSSVNFANCVSLYFQLVCKVIDPFGSENKPQRLSSLRECYQEPVLPELTPELLRPLVSVPPPSEGKKENKETTELHKDVKIVSPLHSTSEL